MIQTTNEKEKKETKAQRRSIERVEERQNNVGGVLLHFTIFKVCNNNLSITATRRSSIERVEDIDKILSSGVISHFTTFKVYIQ